MMVKQGKHRGHPESWPLVIVAWAFILLYRDHCGIVFCESEAFAPGREHYVKLFADEPGRYFIRGQIGATAGQTIVSAV